MMVFEWFFGLWSELFDELMQYQVFQNVTLPQILLGFLVMSIIISVFWKGGRG